MVRIRHWFIQRTLDSCLDEAEELQVILLFNLATAYFIFTLLCIPLIGFIDSLWLSVGALVCNVFLLLCLIFFRIGSSAKTITLLQCSSLFCGATSVLLAMGGNFSSTALLFTVQAVFLSFLILGRIWGIISIGLTFTLIGAHAAARVFNFSFPEMTLTTDAYEIITLTTSTGCLFILGYILSIYLQAKIKLENNLFLAYKGHESLSDQLFRKSRELKQALKQTTEANDQLIESQLMLTALVSSLDDIVLQINEDKYLVNAWNSRDSFQLLPDVDLSGRLLSDMFEGMLGYRLEKAVDQALASFQVGAIEFMSPQTELWYLAKIVPIMEHQSQTRFVSILFQNIDQRKKSEEALKAYKNLFDISIDPVCVMTYDGVFKLVNPAFSQVLGYDEKTYMNKPLIHFLHPDDIPTLSEARKKLKYRNDNVDELELRFRSKDDSYITLLWSANIDRDNGLLYCIAKDITQQKKDEKRLRESEKLLREAQETAKMGSWSCDVETGTITWSKETYRIYGVEEDFEPGPKKSRDFYDEESLERYDELWQTGLKEDLAFEEILGITTPAGAHKWIKIIGKPYYGEGAGKIYMGTLQDITEEREAAIELEKAKEKAEGATVAKTQFLSTMSHEIRTPMNAVIGLTHLLLQENPRDDQLDNLQTLKFSAENLLSLINDILDFSKIEAGKIEFEQISFKLVDMVNSIKHSMEYKAKEKGIELKLEIDKRIPETVKGDPTRLAQILNNLISNAVKFTEKGYVKMAISNQGIDKNGIKLGFTVKDTGIGIPAEKLDSIFESFSQASSATTRKYGGTGLGLAITKKLLDLFGSNIQVLSTEGEGTTFSFVLTMGLPDASEKVSTTYLTDETANTSWAGDILLAEDNKVNVKIACKFLKKWGLEVDVAENGLIAVQLAEKKKYDLVLMDLQMPVMDGYEATKQIRELYPDIPIIALTASALLEVKAEAIAAGMSDYASKPFNPTELKKKINQFLSSESLVNFS